MGNNIAFQIGENIRLYRNKAHLTQEQLADSIKVKRSVISKYENGSIEPSLSQLSRIADALSISADLLLSDVSFQPDVSFQRGQKCDLNFFQIDHEFNIIRQQNIQKVTRAMELLNSQGQAVAVQRIQELTEIPRYQLQPETPTADATPPEGKDSTQE